MKDSDAYARCDDVNDILEAGRFNDDELPIFTRADELYLPHGVSAASQISASFDYFSPSV